MKCIAGHHFPSEIERYFFSAMERFCLWHPHDEKAIQDLLIFKLLRKMPQTKSL